MTTVNPVLGVFLHAVGGLAAGSFYIFFKPVKKWSWEAMWLVAGFAMWLVAPWVVSFLKVPHLMEVLRNSPTSSMLWAYVWGVAWGFGAITYGLSMRYLGLSLGAAIALGNCALFGTIMPPIFEGKFIEKVSTPGGMLGLVGLLVCIAGIAICGWAGIKKDREAAGVHEKTSFTEFNLVKGFWIAVFCGIMSACFNYGIVAGAAIAGQAVKYGVEPLWQNTPVFIFVCAGGLTTNIVWIILLHIKNKTGGDYVDTKAPLAINYIFAGLAGVVWYFQFMFYGMGNTQMGKVLEFASWSLHMAFIIIFSNIWGYVFKEWRGTTGSTKATIFAGIVVLILSTWIIGYGAAIEKNKSSAGAEGTAKVEQVQQAG